MSLFVKNTQPMLFYIKTHKGKKELSNIITAYGGRISSTRGQADMCLAHPQTESLIGDFFSTQYITDCVEENALLEIDSYKLNTIPPSPELKEKAVFSSQDLAILKHALKNSNHSLFGDRLYKEIAARYPRHTWQSWKDYALAKYPNHAQDQENVNQTNMKNPILEKNVPGVAKAGVTDESVESANTIPENPKEDLKKRMISEADKLLIDRFLQSYNRICDEYDLWDKEDIMKAMIMASGSLDLTKKILDSGFNIQDLDDAERNSIFSPEDDTVISQKEIHLLKALVSKKGRASVEDRVMFLSNFPYIGAAELISKQC